MRIRFVAKGLKAQRSRLDISAADYARLVGVSAQSVYNWEHGHARPGAEQLGKIAKLRSIGKREARFLLKQLRSTQSPKTKGSAKSAKSAAKAKTRGRRRVK